jgi:two-component system, OmpR family, phosphate regulon sensor histidine kinase PhoR
VLDRLSLGLALTSIIIIAIVAPSIWSTQASVFMIFSALFGASLVYILVNNNSSANIPTKEPTRNKESSNFASTEELFEIIMNGMREGVLVMDQSMRVVACNNAAKDIFNHIKEPLKGSLLINLTRHPDIYSAFHLAINKKERSDVKIELNIAERQTFDLRVVPLPLGPDQNTCGAIGVFFDITQIERLERVRQEFLSNVSHELRTPLTAILAFVETLEDGAMDDKENNRHFLSVIRKNATRMHNLIDDILELSAIESGMVLVKPIQVNLRQLVGDITTALASKAEVRHITIRNEINQDVAVYADAHRLEQMLTNLIDNAIKFNSIGGSISITHVNGNLDRICVTDTGDGIPHEHVERIFERFYRVDRARSRDLGGTGLGLAIVKHLARAHGGDVSVQSILGKGSTFIVDLPHVSTDVTPDTNLK